MMSVSSSDQICDPLSEYIERRNHFQSAAESLEQRQGRLGNIRFILVIFSGILLVTSSFERSVPSWSAAIPFGIFLVTSPWAQRFIAPASGSYEHSLLSVRGRSDER